MSPWVIFSEYNYAEEVVYEKPSNKNLRENQSFLEVSIQDAGDIEEVLKIPQAISKNYIERHSKKN